MLDERELATVLAALLFWQEEMCPHDRGIMLPYFTTVGFAHTVPLSAAEIDLLAQRLRALNG